MTFATLSRLLAGAGLTLTALWPIATASQQSGEPRPPAAEERVTDAVLDHLANLEANAARPIASP